MALPTFNPSVQPSPGTGQEPIIKLREAEFGDGYTQAGPDGLNHIRQQLTLTWDGLTEDQMQEIYGFLTGQGGYQPFYYQSVGDTVVRKWTCKKWSRSKPAGVFKVMATFVEHFTNLT